jgi:hypothetical protein
MSQGDFAHDNIRVAMMPENWKHSLLKARDCAQCMHLATKRRGAFNF